MRRTKTAKTSKISRHFFILILSDAVSIVQEWRDMKVKKKAKWIRKAMKEFREYEERVVEFKAGRHSELEFLKSLWGLGTEEE